MTPSQQLKHAKIFDQTLTLLNAIREKSGSEAGKWASVAIIHAAVFFLAATSRATRPMTGCSASVMTSYSTRTNGDGDGYSFILRCICRRTNAFYPRAYGGAMSQPICKHCGQQIGPSSMRGGVYLSAQRRRVFDKIKTRPGLSALELAAQLYPDKPSAAGARTVIQTVHHINDQLASTNVRIKKCGYRVEGDND